ncbi:MAG: D-2-hydroxyacid dehydrogenase family protein [Acidimicrobiales bacterium]|nr:D-2-hydroxyacid dehydrogenase family protein [Acidimicrobiales bacterium]
MTRIAVLDDYIGCAQEFGDWAALGDDAEITFYREAIDPERLTEELADYEILAITQQRTWFPRQVLERLPKLELIVCNGPTSNVIDHEYRRERGIMLCGTADLPAGGRIPADARPPRPDPRTRRGIATPAEMAWALLFAVTKRIGIEDRVIRSGGWQTGFPVPLSGLTLGLAGLGNLGSMMVAPARVFGMDVIAWSQNLTDERAKELDVPRVSKEELLRRSDVLGIFLVLSDRTRGLFQREDLALMKPTAFIVNISRGPIIDEAALVDALRGGRLAGAGLDVFDREPLPADHPLRSMENVVLMPHVGYVTEAGFRRSFSLMAEDIAAFMKGQPIRVVE